MQSIRFSGRVSTRLRSAAPHRSSFRPWAATVEGQLSIIHHYNITEESMGCEIRASMDTVHLGFVEETVPVYFDRIAYEQADAVIPVGRVKPHTDFVGPIESGLMKMLAIG